MSETNKLGYVFKGDNANHGQAQVRFSDSKFATILRDYAEKSTNIVEIGTWLGQGSTYCLWKGMNRPEQRLWTVEVNQRFSQQAAATYDDPRMTFLWGHVSGPELMPEPEGSKEDIGSYEHEKSFVIPTNPCVLTSLPDKIDLCLMDGGNWNGWGDFTLLAGRSRWVALDDTNVKVKHKNHCLRQRMIDEGWKILFDMLEDRAGTLLAENPKKR